VFTVVLAITRSTNKNYYKVSFEKKIIIILMKGEEEKEISKMCLYTFDFKFHFGMLIKKKKCAWRRGGKISRNFKRLCYF
jgi:hypothetical protein